MAEEIKVENAEVKVEATAEAETPAEEVAEKKVDWPYASYPEGYNKLLNKIMPFWQRPMKKMMGALLIRVLVDG